MRRLNKGYLNVNISQATTQLELLKVHKFITDIQVVSQVTVVYNRFCLTSVHGGC